MVDKMEIDADSPRRSRRDRGNGVSGEKAAQQILKAEDLIENDDLLCATFIDTLGQRKKQNLGVRFQQSDFICPVLDTKLVCSIVAETVARGDLHLAIYRTSTEVSAIKLHLASKDTAGRRRFNAHLERYLRLYLPTARVEIDSTDRYKWKTGHTELAVYATKDIAPTSDKDWRGFQKLLHESDDFLEMGKIDTKDGTSRKTRTRAAKTTRHFPQSSSFASAAGAIMLDELKGAMEVVPSSWKLSLDVAQDIDHPMGLDGNGEGVSQDEGIDGLRGTQKLCEATGTNSKGSNFVIRDHSLVQTASKGLVFLLGPGRFMNHDCDPHVVLHATGLSSLSFKVLRPIRVGEEITTFYGRHYFGRWNTDCLCSTCEQKGMGGFSSSREGTSLSSPDLASELVTDATSTAETMEKRRPGGSETEASILLAFEANSSDASGHVTPLRRSFDIAEGPSRPVTQSVTPRALAQLENADLVSPFVQDIGERRRITIAGAGSTSASFTTPRERRAESKGTDSDEGSPSGTPSRQPRRRAAVLGRETTTSMYHSPFGKRSRRDAGHGRVTHQPHDLPDPPGVHRCEHCCSRDPLEISRKDGGSAWLCFRCQRHWRIYHGFWPSRIRARPGQHPEPPKHLRPSWWINMPEPSFSEPQGRLPATHNDLPLQQPLHPRETLDARKHRLAEEQAEAQRTFDAAVKQANQQHEMHVAQYAASRTASQANAVAGVRKGAGVWRRWEYADVKADEPEAGARPGLDAASNGGMGRTRHRSKRFADAPRDRATAMTPPTITRAGPSSSGALGGGDAKILLRIPARWMGNGSAASDESPSSPLFPHQVLVDNSSPYVPINPITSVPVTAARDTNPPDVVASAERDREEEEKKPDVSGALFMRPYDDRGQPIIFDLVSDEEDEEDTALLEPKPQPIIARPDDLKPKVTIRQIDAKDIIDLLSVDGDDSEREYDEDEDVGSEREATRIRAPASQSEEEDDEELGRKMAGASDIDAIPDGEKREMGVDPSPFYPKSEGVRRASGIAHLFDGVRRDSGMAHPSNDRSHEAVKRKKPLRYTRTSKVVGRAYLSYVKRDPNIQRVYEISSNSDNSSESDIEAPIGLMVQGPSLSFGDNRSSLAPLHASGSKRPRSDHSGEAMGGSPVAGPSGTPRKPQRSSVILAKADPSDIIIDLDQDEPGPEASRTARPLSLGPRTQTINAGLDRTRITIATAGDPNAMPAKPKLLDADTSPRAADRLEGRSRLGPTRQEVSDALKTVFPISPAAGVAQVKPGAGANPLVAAQRDAEVNKSGRCLELGPDLAAALDTRPPIPPVATQKQDGCHTETNPTPQKQGRNATDLESEFIIQPDVMPWSSIRVQYGTAGGGERGQGDASVVPVPSGLLWAQAATGLL